MSAAPPAADEAASPSPAARRSTPCARGFAQPAASRSGTCAVKPMVPLRFVAAEEAQRVRAALAELAARDRAVIELLFIEQLRYGFLANRAASASAEAVVVQDLSRTLRRRGVASLHRPAWPPRDRRGARAPLSLTHVTAHVGMRVNRGGFGLHGSGAYSPN